MSLFLVSCETLIRCVRAEGSIFRQVRFASGLSYRHHVGKEPLIYQTVGDLVDSAAERFPDRIAIKSCHENKIFTFKQVQEQTNKIAAALVGMGFQKGDRLALWGPNTVYWYLTFLASAKAGLISVLINSSFQKGELEYCLKKVGATGIVTASKHKSQNFYDLIVETCPDLVHAEIGKLNNRNIPSFKYAIITDEDKFKGALQWKDLEKFADKTAYELLDERKKQITPDDAFNLQFTSGTTGKPKGAFVSHYKYVNNSYYISKRYELYDKQHKLCLHVPLFHAFGTDAMICPALHSGATIIMPWYSFDPVKSLEIIEKEKCSFVGGTPTMHIDLINAQKTQNRDISSLEIAVTGGAICPPQLFKDILSDLKVKKVKSIFGQTEACGVVFQSKPGDDLFYSTETVGFIGEHVEAKVVNKEGLTVPLGVAGELYVRGYCVMLGYWDDEVKTKEAIGNDGWLRTGVWYKNYMNSEIVC